MMEPYCTLLFDFMLFFSSFSSFPLFILSFFLSFYPTFRSVPFFFFSLHESLSLFFTHTHFLSYWVKFHLRTFYYDPFLIHQKFNLFLATLSLSPSLSLFHLLSLTSQFFFSYLPLYFEKTLNTLVLIPIISLSLLHTYTPSHCFSLFF